MSRFSHLYSWTSRSSTLSRIERKLDIILLRLENVMPVTDEILTETKRNSALTTQILTTVGNLHDENKALHDQIAAAVPADNTAAQEALATLKANDDAMDKALNPQPSEIPPAPQP